MRSSYYKIERQNGTVRWSIVASGAALVGLSALDVLTFPLVSVATLTIALVVASLVSKFEMKLPGSDSVFYPKTVFAIWGAATIGLFPSIILMAVASAASQKDSRADVGNWSFKVSKDVIATFISAAAFHFGLAYFSGPEATIVAGRFLVPNGVIFSATLMAAAYVAVVSSIDLLIEKLERGEIARHTAEAILVTPLIGQGLGLAAAICLFLTFNHFGIEFGLVLVPLAIGANVAYQIHIRSLAQKTKQITEASRVHLATVEALATAIDARDQVGIGHVRRTQIYAVGLGRLLDLPRMMIDALENGALLHDVGKLAVPDHILNKPGQLTPAEMEKTKIHSYVGASMLEKVGFQSPVVPTIKYHHEAWDGSGYPEGLRGSQIPLTARILSIADAFDTLRGERPYRPPVSREDACSFLRAGAGTRFDPKLVDLFLRNLRVFEEEIAGEGLEYEFDPAAASAISAESSFVEQIKRANREVFTLYSLARDFGSALGLKETVSLFADKVKEFVPYDCCAIYLLDISGEFADAVHVAGTMGASLSGKRIRIGEGATGYALKKRKAVENVDPALDFAFTAGHDLQNLKTMGSMPLMADDKIIGAVSIYTAELPLYQDEHFRLLDTVSRIAADAISKSQQHEQAETHALTDPITGLPNARSLHFEFEKEVKRSIRTNSTFQLLMLDLDGFKAVNDTLGHKVGDDLLTEIGGVIRTQLRDYDFLSRYAGDEFVALIPETDNEGVIELCRRIETAVTGFGLNVSENETAKVGVSIGSACYPLQGESFDQLVICADRAMYLMKAANKRKRLMKDMDETSISSEASSDVALADIPDTAVMDDDKVLTSSSVN